MAGSPPRLLVVDDDGDIREVVVSLLQDEGYATLEAGTGFDALALLRQSDEPLVVLLDLLMPVMTGFEVLSQIAVDQALATRHRYVVMSARPYRRALESRPHVERLFQQLGISFIEKPFDIDDLLRTVRAAWGALGYHQRRAGRPDASDDTKMA